MSLAAFALTTAAKQYIGDGTIDLDSDTFKAALVSSASNIGAGTTNFGGVTNELATANGYTSGGFTVTTNTYVGAKWKTDNIWWQTAATGFSARWMVIYKVGTANGVVNPVLGYVLLDATPADFVFAANKREEFACDATNGWFNLA